MNKQELEFHLIKLGIRPNEMAWREHVNQVSIPCQLAKWFHGKGTDKKPSLSIKYSDTEPTVWKCFSCLEYGKLWELFDSVAVLTKDEILRDYARSLMDSDSPSLNSRLSQACADIDNFYEITAKKHELILDPVILNNYPPAYDTLDGRLYLEGRRVSLGQSQLFGLRYDYRNQRIVFPVTTRSGFLIGAVGRTIGGDDPRKYYNYFNFRAGSCLGGIDKIQSSHKTIAVVEGFFDLIKGYPVCQSLGIDIVASWHAELNPEQQNILVALDKTVLLCYDMDEAGNRGSAKAMKAMQEFIPIRRLKWEGENDVAEICEKDEKKWEQILQNALEIKLRPSDW